jgi:BirA family biotin operon repressor/biotin-[acetyl-CoA-carboxylase] ligase
VNLAALTTRWLARSLDLRAETASTNDDAMAAARAGAPHGHTVIADTQTRGRGRQGHTWFSPPGANLYLSVLVRTSLPPPRVPPITLAAGVAVCEAVNAFGVRASLKWPNDIVVPTGMGTSFHKLGGILTEMSTRGGHAEAVVVGIGVNVNTVAFPPEIAAIATSLAREAGGAPLDRDAVAVRLCGALETWIDVFLAGRMPEVAAAWRARAFGLGKRVRVAADEGMLEGVAVDVDDDGALRLDTGGGRVTRVIAGEIQLVPAGESEP